MDSTLHEYQTLDHGEGFYEISIHDFAHATVVAFNNDMEAIRINVDSSTPIRLLIDLGSITSATRQGLLHFLRPIEIISANREVSVAMVARNLLVFAMLRTYLREHQNVIHADLFQARGDAVQWLTQHIQEENS